MIPVQLNTKIRGEFKKVSKSKPSKKTAMSQWHTLPTVLLDIIFTNLNDPNKSVDHL